MCIKTEGIRNDYMLLSSFEEGELKCQWKQWLEDATSVFFVEF